MSDEVVVAIEERIEVVTEGIQGPAGPPGPMTGLSAVVDDPSPELGGDLELGIYNINGQLENPGLILDGGLL